MELHCSNIRSKVDVLNIRENGDSNKPVLLNSKCNLRMSLSWDNAFFTSPGVLEPEELFTTLNSRNYNNVVNILGKEEHLLLSSQSLEEPEAENYNYRKSLAWDNGFFTSEGVLNPFELAIVNNSYKKSESHLLPVDEDEVWMSMESKKSTLDNEASSLTRLEMDLFEDFRASITKPNPSRFEPVSAVQDGSGTMMKAMPTCKRHSINKHGSKKITRDMSNTPKIQMKHMSESTEHFSSYSIKPSKPLEKLNCVSKGSTRREKHVKLGCKSRILASAEGLGKLRKPCLRESTQSLRSSLIHFSPQTTIEKSPPNPRSKNNSQGSNVIAARPASRTPLMKTRTNKTEVESSCLFTPTSSWNGSPSESSSISSTRRSNRSKHSPYSSLGSSLMKIKNHHRKDCKGDANTDASSCSILREVKPSGLRMPSPKLGFFDPENMLVDAKRDAIRCAKLQSPRTLPTTEIRIRKSGGTSVLVSATKSSRSPRVMSPRTLPTVEIRNRKSGGTPVLVSATKSNMSPRVMSHNQNVQCCSNRSIKVDKMVAPYHELKFQISHDDNKENQISLMDHQVESLVKQVNFIDLKAKIAHLN